MREKKGNQRMTAQNADQMYVKSPEAGLTGVWESGTGLYEFVWI
jgi:hypothetical protein